MAVSMMIFMNFRTIRFFSVLIFLCGNAVSLTHASERIALVIGNGQYQTFGTLSNPINDAQDIAEALTSLGFTVVYEENATKQVMQQAIGRFTQKLRENSIGVFYYAGHGTQHAGENYLIPVDFHGRSENAYQEQAVVAQQILIDMNASGSTTNVMILDACRDNPFAQSSTRGLRSGGGNGLAEMSKVAGSYIAFSTSPGKVAYDGEGRNSPYASHLIRTIKEPIPIEIMFKRVRTAVVGETKHMELGSQVPWENSSLLGDTDFCFVEGCGQTTGTSDYYQPTIQQCKMSWGNGQYQGECKAGKPDGHGIQRYANGEYYKGMFRNGLRHGQGVQYLPDGTEIAADWLDGRPR